MTASGQGLKILLVDDDPWIQNLLCDYLAHDGHALTAAGTAGEALEILRSTPIDLVLLDYHLPDLNGFQVLHRLRRDHPRLAVMLLTADRTLAEELEKVHTGALACFFKPIDLDQLSESLAIYARLARRVTEGGGPPHDAP
jgi:DNA-binding response OmpR family regulator